MSYAYNAELFCDICAELTIIELDHKNIEDSGDTNDYPQYCYNDESDCPEHCAGCGEFLKNSLTSDGYDYVEDRVREALIDGTDCVAISIWKDFYSIMSQCKECGCEIDPECEYCDDCK